jgi:cytochrome c553
MAMSLLSPRILAAVALAAAACSARAENLEAGKKFATEVCVACHGIDGNSTNPDYPKLGGQYPDYLAKALRDYQSGARNNAIMKGFATMLKDTDIADVAAWYASQPRVLSPHPATRN